MHRTCAVPVLFLLAAGGCGASLHGRSSASLVDPATSPPAVELTQPVACTFATASWAGRSRVTDLSLLPHGPAFVRIGGGASQLAIPIDKADTALVTVEQGGLLLRGHVAAQEVVLHASRPFVLSGLAVPTLFADLSWSSGAAGGLTVLHELPRELTLIDPPLRATRPCADLALEHGTYGATEYVVATAGPKLGERMLKPEHPIAIALTPGGTPAAQLVLREATLVDLLAERAGFAKITFELSTLSVFGWVRAVELHPPEPGIGYGTGHGVAAIQDPPQTIVARLRCPDELPVIGQVREQRRTVGLIRRDTTIEVMGRVGDETSVWVQAKDIHPLPEASLRVRTAALLRCQPVAAAGGARSDTTGSERRPAE